MQESGRGEGEQQEADEIVSPLFEALSDCSALHDSILPNGETSSFPFFPPGEDDEDEGEDWEDDEEGMNGDGDAAEGTGRVRSDFHSGGGPGNRFRPY